MLKAFWGNPMLVGNSKLPSASSRGDTGQVTRGTLRDSVVNS
jgi:hypothetical protein